MAKVKRAETANSMLPPSISEQKRLRQKNHSIVPSSPYLLASKLVDVACELPVIRKACPDGVWRASLPLGWSEFPHGKLSHSFSSYFGDDISKDNSYTDFLQSESAIDSSTLFGTSHIKASITNYYNFVFHTSTTTICDLSNPHALKILFLLVLVLRIVKKLLLPKFSSLGRHLGRSTHGLNWEHSNQDRIEKFGEYVYRLCYHIAVSIFGLWYFHDKSWWNKTMGGTKNLWISYPNHPVEPGMAWYYLVQCAYNVDAMLSLLQLSFQFEWVNPMTYSSALEFLEKEHVMDETLRKKEVYRLMVHNHYQRLIWTPLFQVKWSPSIRGDFREMMAHHVVTNMLIFGSSFYRLTRIGSMIFLVHDLSDVPIDMSKLANFVKWKATTVICFVVMVLMWIITRLYIFPFVIFRSVLFESYEYMVVQGPIDPALYEAYCYIFYSLLGVLVMLHVTWFLILLRIGWTLIKKGETHDYSEHKTGEKEQLLKKD